MTQGPIATEAFPRWLELTGVDPAHFQAAGEGQAGPTRYTLRSYDAAKAAVGIFEALSLPDHELTAQMLMARELDAFMEEATFTLADLVGQPATVQRPLALCRDLRAILDRPALVQARHGFVHALSQSLSHYGALGNPEVMDLLEDTHALAALRRDALGSLDQLRTSQFLSGDPGEPTRPRYSTAIRRWWDIDHLLAAHASIPEGVTLNLVATPAAHDVFFCFVVRRGGNLYLIDDAADYAHPLQSQMSRSPGRRMAERVERFWFPYELAEVALSEDGRSVRSRSTQGKGKAASQPRAVDAVSQVVGAVADLPPSELVWTVLMFDLIAARFFSPHPLPALPISYTANQLLDQAPQLARQALAAGLPVVAPTPAQQAVPPLAREQVAAMHLDGNAEQILGQTGNLTSLAWLERRYGPKVPPEAFNAVAPGQSLLRLASNAQLERLDSPDHKKLEGDRFFGRDTSLATLQALPTTTIGTAERLRADRGFLARYNYAKSINGLAHQEFKQRREEVLEWLARAYGARQDFLLSLAPAVKHQPLVVVDWEAGQGPEEYEFHNGMGARSATSRGSDEEESFAHELVCLTALESSRGSFAVHVPLPTPGSKFRSVCPLTGAKPSFYLVASPTNALELAWLLGKQVHELPDVLQDLGALGPSHGNSILDRIDPMLWALENPWHKLRLTARVPLSKRGLATLEKQHPAKVDIGFLHGENLRRFQPPKPQAPRPPR